ncbi:hypothetical protein ACVW03_000749 [Pantoea agglomerans]|jgi:hypothetical protein
MTLTLPSHYPHAPVPQLQVAITDPLLAIQDDPTQ